MVVLISQSIVILQQVSISGVADLFLVIQLNSSVMTLLNLNLCPHFQLFLRVYKAMVPGTNT